jgi:hypothetical protein
MSGTPHKSLARMSNPGAPASPGPGARDLFSPPPAQAHIDRYRIRIITGAFFPVDRTT